MSRKSTGLDNLPQYTIALFIQRITQASNKIMFKLHFPGHISIFVINIVSPRTHSFSLIVERFCNRQTIVKLPFYAPVAMATDPRFVRHCDLFSK